MHLVGFTIEIYYGARAYERQTSVICLSEPVTHSVRHISGGRRLIQCLYLRRVTHKVIYSGYKTLNVI